MFFLVFYEKRYVLHIPRSIVWLFFCSLSWAGVPADYQPPAGFVDLQQAIPGIRIQAGYHSAHNFTGAPLPGYGVNAAWLHKKAAAALGKVQQQLTSEGLGLLVYDAYRPARATQAMMAWVRRTKQHRLVTQGYISPRSRHNHGVAVDLTLVSLEDGKPLDMGGVWDTFTKQAHTGKATGKILANRQKLAAM